LNKNNGNEQKIFDDFSLDDKRQYEYDKIKEGLPQLRIIFFCFAVLYGAFGYLDYLMIADYKILYFIIHFVIVIPLFLLLIVMSYYNIFYRIAKFMLTLCLIAGGVGIAYMLIKYPSNFSYYGGMFMAIFSGYFLLKLSTSYAIMGNMIVLLFYTSVFVIINGAIGFDTLMVIAFFIGANIVGALGNFQFESMAQSRYLQKKEIKNKNILLEARVITQNNELLQIKKAFESTSDAMAIFNPSEQLVNYNRAFTKMMHIEDPAQKKLFKELDKIVHSVIEDKPQNAEINFTDIKNIKKTILVQGDLVYEGSEVIGTVMTFKDITERKVAEERIKYIASHDNLTGLFNRYWYDEEVSDLRLINQLPLSIIMADLNGLKLLNDTYGHEIGDKILKSAAEVLKSVCRKSDLVARLGGDEFIILLPNTSYEQAITITNRIAKESSEIYCEGVPLSMTMGVASNESEEDGIPSIMKVAEDMMYRLKLTESRSAKSAILNALNKAMQVKSFETEAHTGNMHQFAKRVGMRLGLSADELSRLDLVIRLHDIGKINIPGEILGKKSPLTPDEWVIMKKHAEIGYRIALATEEFAHVAQEILSHHERWDGTGYPQNLKGEEIPYVSRIVSIVDSYEVMLNGRPYKKPMSKSDIVDEFKRCAGSQFDPNLVELFLKEIT
jgi:diguanylate cyclase (GGDEF)-like protein